MAALLRGRDLVTVRVRVRVRVRARVRVKTFSEDQGSLGDRSAW